MRISDWSSAVCSSDLQQLGDSGVKRQLLLLPEVVELDEPAAQRLAERAGELAELGLVVEAFGPGAVVVREVPALLGEVDVRGLVRDLADEIGRASCRESVVQYV